MSHRRGVASGRVRLSPKDFETMEALAEANYRNRMSATDLADDLGVSRTAAIKRLATLERKGMLRPREPGKHRQWRLNLSAHSRLREHLRDRTSTRP